MLHEVTGDILLSKAQWLAHGVAPLDGFQTGLGHALRERWPSCYKDFRHYCHTYSPKPGTLWSWSGVGAPNQPSVHIVSLFTQEAAAEAGGRPGRAHTEHVNHTLHALRKLVVAENVRSLALPRLATGMGALDWKHVEPLVRATLGELKIPVFVYTTYKKGVQAVETGA